MPIIVVDPNRTAHRLEREVIVQEDYLQQYIHQNPDVLPLGDLNPAGKLLVVAREFRTGSGPIDALAIDGDGAIYIIETKLYKNPDKRRVIAQMLDYGAALWSAGPEAFLAEANCNGDLETKLTDAYSLEEEDLGELLSTLKANVKDGQFQFVVLMDVMDERLKDLVKFVNQNSSFAILGVEIDFFKHGDLDILIPRLYGDESRKRDEGSKSRGSGRRWTEEQFFEMATQNLTPDQMQGIREVYDWARRTAVVGFGVGQTYGSFNATFPDVYEKPLFKFNVVGRFVVRVSPRSDFGRAFRNALGDAGFALPAEGKKPVILIEDWLQVRDKLLRTIETFIAKQRAAGTVAVDQPV